jgi:hypothetical protein
MKHFNLGTLFLAMSAGLLAWGAYDYFANRPINHETCGVTIAPKDGQVSIPAFTATNRVPLKLINRSGRPVKIVGNNAC